MTPLFGFTRSVVSEHDHSYWKQFWQIWCVLERDVVNRCVKNYNTCKHKHMKQTGIYYPLLLILGGGLLNPHGLLLLGGGLSECQILGKAVCTCIVCCGPSNSYKTASLLRAQALRQNSMLPKRLVGRYSDIHILAEWPTNPAQTLMCCLEAYDQVYCPDIKHPLCRKVNANI